MPNTSASVQEIETAAAVVRARMRANVSSLAHQARPSNISKLVSNRISERATEIGENAAEKLRAFKDAGGGAVAGVVGAALSFELGRWSRRDASPPRETSQPISAGVYSQGGESGSAKAKSARPMDVAAVAKAAAIGAAGLSAGFLGSALLPRTDAEARLTSAGSRWLSARARELASVTTYDLLKRSIHATGVSRYAAMGVIGMSILSRLSETSASGARRTGA
jgi:hypothetical protein